MPALTFANREELNLLEIVVLDHLARALRSGWCPSREELSRAVGFGGRGYRINSILESLQGKGYVALLPGRSRAISLLRTSDGWPFRNSTIWVPLAGKVAAGYPLSGRDAQEAVGSSCAGEAIELTRSLLGGYGEVYALQVSGDSMRDALVNDGDIIVLSSVSEAQNGDMVVARVVDSDGQAATTLKYFYRDNGHVRLQPAHPHMQPLLYHPDRVTVQGKVVLVIRRTD